MELFVLNNKFQRVQPVDRPNSAIWTERYGTAGDVTLMCPLTQYYVDLIVEGTFLALKGSKEVMLLDSVLIENGQLKATGNTLDKFLENRIIRNVVDEATGTRWYGSGGLAVQTPEVQINQAVARLLVAGGNMTDGSIGVDGARQVITNLSIDSSGNNSGLDLDPLAWPEGMMYDVFAQFASTYKVGFRLYLDWAKPDGTYSLKFNAYSGVDRTSDQTIRPLVRFSPDLESLSGVSKLTSIAGYKNVAYVFPPTSLTEASADGTGNPALPATAGIAYATPEAETSIDFDRRTIMETASDITYDSVGGSADTLLKVLNQKAKDLLANNNFVKVVDGEVIPQSKYQFGTDYWLGDIIELDDGFGTLGKARITEFIRSQDKDGERAYPSLTTL